MLYSLKELEEIKQNLTIDELLEVVYTLKVLKDLSKSDCYDIDLFNKKYFGFIDFKRQLESLRDNKNFSVLYTEINKIENIEDNQFNLFLNIILNDQKLPSIYESFEYREGLHTSVVSKQIVQLSIPFLEIKEQASIGVPFKDGLKISELTDKKVCCEYADSKKQFVASLLALSSGKEIDLRITNSLENPSFIENDELIEFDYVIAFPPLGLRGYFDGRYDKFNRFKLHQNSKRLDVANFEHVLSQTKYKAIVLMPVGFTYRTGIEEDFRKYLIENNFLDAMIQMPPNMYSATSIETTLFIINKKRNTSDDVLFINLKDEKFLTKIGRKTVLKDIDYITNIYLEKKLDENSKFISREEIKSNDYNFSIDRYIDKSEDINTIEKWEKLEDIATIRKSQTIKDTENGDEVSELSPSDFLDAGFTINGLKIKHIDVSEKQFQTYHLKPYDVLISAKGVVGKIGIVGENINHLLASQAIQVIRLKETETTKDDAICLYMYLKSYMGQKALHKIVQGTAMPQISTKELRKFQIPSLSNMEKSKVVNSFNEEIEIFNKIQILQNKVSEIHENYLK